MAEVSDATPAEADKGLNKPVRYWDETIIVVIACAATMAVFWIIWGRLMPSNTGLMGHDFAGMLPALLAGRYWFETNGLFVTPWFLPSFCGGIWLFPTGGYYSVPQFLAFVMSPLAAVQTTFVVFAGLGFMGAFLLARRAFHTTVIVALVAAILMAMNGFYAYRSIIGHFPFHGFMLLPLMCYFALRSRSARETPTSSQFPALSLQVIGIAACWAYFIHSGAEQLLLHFGLATALVLLLHGLVVGPSWRPWVLMTMGGILGLLLSAAKLNAAFSVTAALPRTGYKLPGASDLLESAGLILRSLFFEAPSDATGQLENVQWALERHEWEFGLSPVALILLVIGGVMLVRLATKAAVDGFLQNKTRVFLLVSLLALAFVPIALNTYGEDWNAFLKATPILGSMSSMVRWICAYIPLLVILCALSLNKLFVDRPKRQTAAALMAMIGIIAYHATTDKAFYKAQPYSPESMQSAYQRLQETGNITPVIGTGVFFDAQTNAVQTPLNRNDTFVNGWSQLACYAPQFGYALEWFPQKTLQPGPATDIREGRYNFKDPSCYVFPEANKCEPGDHFKVGEEQRMQKLLNYQPYEFRFSQSQEIANLISLVSWLAAGLVLAVALFAALRRRLPNTKAAATASPGRDAG